MVYFKNILSFFVCKSQKVAFRSQMWKLNVGKIDSACIYDDKYLRRLNVQLSRHNYLLISSQ